jgi:hypothetical protein
MYMKHPLHYPINEAPAGNEPPTIQSCPCGAATPANVTRNANLQRGLGGLEAKRAARARGQGGWPALARLMILTG